MTDLFDYTPDKVDRILRNWEHYTAVAETPGTASQLLTPYREGPTPTRPRTAKQRGHHSDPLRGSDVVADIQRAAKELPPGLGADAVCYRMWGYISMSAIAIGLRRRGQDVRAAYKACCEQMAITLGWEPPPPEATEEGEEREADP